ncbi:MAG: SDR family NAD(P)-dependent oxidoreductase [Anaerolineales bacterium]
MPDLEFQDHTVIVAGAGGNLGSSVATLFLKTGANLILVDYSEEKLQRLFPELIESDQHIIFQGVDINNSSSINAVINRTMSKFGQIDILVNSIGGYEGGFPIQETSDEIWDMLFNLNARAVFNLARVVTPIMKEAQSGKIINISARLGLKGTANQAVYSAAKSAVIRLTEAMAQELKNDDINVNCILPGTIDTPQNRASMPNADYSRWITPDAIAEVILFLASDAARAITGASIPVYGKS